MRTFAISLLICSPMLCGDALAQMRAPYGSGTGVNSLGIKTDQPPRVTRNYTIRQPGLYGYGYQSRYYGYSSYGPVIGFGNVGYGAVACPYCGRFGCGGGCRGPIIYPPVVLGNSGFLYGSRPNFSPNIIINNIPPAAPAPPIANPVANPVAPAPRIDPVPNREARQRAWRLIEAGDRNFKAGDFRNAFAHYRKSNEIASELADGYFRTAFAMLALDRWTEATLTIERGLLRNPNWPASGFVLEELFASPDAKRDMFRKLQTAKRNSPHNSDVRFLLGVMLHFDGQRDAAEAEFRRVIEITGRGNHARAFLPADLEPDVEPSAEGGEGNEQVPAPPMEAP